MKYFKNTELAKLYGVSEKSVRNWIQAALENKLDLQLLDEQGKNHIANTSHNTFVIEQLVEKGKKYKNGRGFKNVSPTTAFYDRYDTKQVFDIVSNLDNNSEIPHQYSYFNGGARHWDDYTNKLLDEKLPNSLTNTIELLDMSEEYLSRITKNYEAVNIVDIGVGNSLPLRNLLQYLSDKKLLRRYIAIDTSHDMLAIAKKNIASWFNSEVEFEGYIKDATYDKFEDLLIADSFSNNEKSVVNIVLFVGGTIANLRDPDLSLRTIRNSMGKNDIFVLSRKLDTPASRRFFDFAAGTEAGKLQLKEKIILDMLGIQDSFYSIEQFFDNDLMSRLIQVKLNVDLSINFQIEDKQRSVEFKKGQSITLWRATHQKLVDVVSQLENNGYEVLQASKSSDQQYVQVIAKINNQLK